MTLLTFLILANFPSFASDYSPFPPLAAYTPFPAVIFRSPLDFSSLLFLQHSFSYNLQQSLTALWFYTLHQSPSCSILRLPPLPRLQTIFMAQPLLPGFLYQNGLSYLNQSACKG